MPKAIKRAALLAFLLLVVVLIAGGARLNSFSERISGRGLLTSEIADRARESDRFNLLVLGYGGENHEGGNLTDSILVYSASLDGGQAVQIGIPRDLWVEYPADSAGYRKVNSVYSAALAESGKRGRAAGAAAESISDALGIPIHGWMTVDFGGFRDLVNALGGVEVDVQRSFAARYPQNDDPSKNAKWTTVRFKKGPQEMDGETAIRYARARYVTDNQVEGSDFARAERQQRLVAAIKRKLLSPSGVLRGFGVTGAVQDDVRTNVSAGDLARIFRQGVDEERSIVLSDQNVLVAGTSSDGQYILLPEGGDWSAVHRFVQGSLEGRSTAQEG